MSTASQNNDNQEIDLSQISKKIGNFFEGVSTSLFGIVLFIKRNIIVIGVLFVLGVGLGIYLDSNNKSYNHEIIVTPNFGSNDYLYSKINLLNSKIKERDTAFLVNLGFKDVDKISVVEIKPIIDVYKFINNNTANFELIKLMAEDGDLNKIMEDKLTSKNYPFHQIQAVTSKKITDDTFTKPLLKFLNTSDYYTRLRKEYINNVSIKMKENDSVIKQIDGFLNDFKKQTTNGSRSNNLVYYNENSQLNDIIKTKDGLINEQGALRLEIVDYEKIIKDISIVTNIKDTKSINGKLKLVLPILFIFLFFFFSILKAYYRKEMNKLNHI